MTVIKRDGTEVPYDINKISTAIYKSMIATYGDKADKELADCYASFTTSYINHTNKTGEISIEEIQDIIEDVLMGRDKKLAKIYIRYRYGRQLVREAKAVLAERGC